MCNMTSENKVISPDLVRMAYHVDKESKIGDTLIFMYTEDGKSEKSVLIINEYTGEKLEYHNITENRAPLSNFLYHSSTYGCKIYKNFCFITCNKEFHVIDLNNLREIQSYNNVGYCMEIDDAKYVNIVKRNEMILYSVLEQKEVANIKIDIMKNPGAELHFLNKNIVSVYNMNTFKTHVLYSIKEHKQLYSEETIGDYDKLIKEHDIIMQIPGRIIVYDSDECKEIYNEKALGYKKLDNCNILIRLKNAIKIYSVIERRIIKEIQCIGEGLSWNKTLGNKLYFIGLGKSGIIFNDKNEIIKVLNSDYTISATSYKNCYCDITIFMNGAEDENGYFDENGYLDKRNYYICGDKVFTLKEYLEYLTIKDIKPVYKNDNVSIKHYNITTNKGLKGIMSTKLRSLKINNILGNENILDKRFDFIRDKYLI